MNIRTRRSTLALIGGVLSAAATVACAPVPARRQQFIYVLRIAPGFQDPREWTRSENGAVGRHFERLTRAATEGWLILAGRTTEELATTFGIVIFEAENIEAARQFMEDDPAITAGVMTATLHPYSVALQRGLRVE